MPDPSGPFDPSIFALREVERFREVDAEIESALWAMSPQALLRDLHRPVKSFGVSPMEFQRIELVTDGGRAAAAEAKVFAIRNYRVPIEELIPTRMMVRDSIAERRRIMKAPWADAPKLGKRYLPAGMTFW